MAVFCASGAHVPKSTLRSGSRKPPFSNSADLDSTADADFASGCISRVTEASYIEFMLKTSSHELRDPKTGRLVTVRGLGALKDSTFAIRKGVDLTKPIAKQALKPAARARKRIGKG